MGKSKDKSMPIQYPDLISDQDSTQSSAMRTDFNISDSSSEQSDSKQSWIQRHAIQIFVANFSLLQFTHMSFVVYYIGVVRTIEKRFGLNSTQTGLVMSLNDVVHISVVLFIGYFGRKGHKPLIIACTSMFLSISSLLYASPYFIYGAEDPFIDTVNTTTVISQKSVEQYCTHNNSTQDCSENTQEQQEYTTNSVFYILCVASMLNGLGGSAMQILGMTYVDQNSDKTKSSLYLGIVTSTFALGPITGISIAAFCTRMPENLQETDKLPTDPSWIGAWWLGYVIFSVFLFLFTLPMFFFPKTIREPSKGEQAKKEDTTLTEQIKEFPKATLDLLRNQAFICLLITGIASVYVITGIFINMPRYFEIHFHMPAFKANIGAALPGMAGVFGGFIGGAVMTRFKFTIVDSTKMVVFSLVITTLGLATAMFITCPQINMAGEWNHDHSSVSVERECNAGCGCDVTRITYHPVCDESGLTHFSPCLAGCETSHVTNTGISVYSNCTCVEGSAYSGHCAEPCASQFYAFAVTMLLMSFLSSLGRVPGTVVQFRIVGDDEGSYALGITSFMINLLGFIPGPILFGSLIDSTCQLWQELCGRTGACLFYDTHLFRYKIFGVSLFFQALSVVCGLVLLWAVKRMPDKQKHKQVEMTDGVIRLPGEEKMLLMDSVSSL